MMKPFSLVLVLVLSSSLASATASSLFSPPLPFSLSSIFGGIIGNSDNSELARMCFPDLGDGEACVAEIFGSFFSPQITIGPECCKAIVEIDEDCAQAIFKPLSNSFFSSSVKQYCTYINS
ncbi:unnamed protein product [Arabidopsis thaliana]|uniref:Prolamin-like protein (DUF1278) n=3 Tax=Arabidopsis thaliana TaxID=3702 RepID=A7RED5_ARATH|nr:prolamin-like protein (DUF1278) [Arabidopsis thaliana]ABI34031.1 unknown [Arabidopsis thaliana]AEE73921.1 prolamin-like protein (DUF1278) [Arabidopsis thaliana]CAA0381186.1 unnamed protein product [Arabidopsis thaliana]VYS56148.1 unnamed protein product [Arabidopsis thaliana]|eukprot:NP_001078100.1 prolamin-like protein (DUF1278) [Arabidopsis thaliana]